MSKYLSRDDVLNVPDVQVEEVDVPEWGGTVLVREMTTAEVENMSVRASSRDGKLSVEGITGMRAQVVGWCLVDENGSPLLDKEDIEELNKRSNKVIDRLFTKIMSLTGIDAPGLGMEDLEKKAL